MVGIQKISRGDIERLSVFLFISDGHDEMGTDFVSMRRMSNKLYRI